MAKMPELVELHKQLGDALVVLGINFDAEVETARQAIEKHGLGWRQVHAGSAAAGRPELWERVSGIAALPRVLVLDRQGVLRADVYPHDLEAVVQPLLAERAAGGNADRAEGAAGGNADRAAGAAGPASRPTRRRGSTEPGDGRPRCGEPRR